MEKRRLFTFGCSHTQYQWPSWANILGLNFDQHLNYGKPGTGNQRILNQVIRCHQHYKFRETDTIVIMLSSDDRFDYIERLSDNRYHWASKGSYFGPQDIFTDKFIKSVNQINSYESTFTALTSMRLLLDTIKSKSIICCAFNNYDESQIKSERDMARTERLHTTSLRKEIRSMLDIEESLQTFSHNFEPKTYEFITDGKRWKDGHYTIPIHLAFVKKYFSEFYDSKFDDMVLGWEGGLDNSSEQMFLNYKDIHESVCEFVTSADEYGYLIQ